MVKKLSKLMALALAALMLLGCAAAFGEGSTVTFSDDFENAVGTTNLPVGWAFHSYQEEYLGNSAASFAKVEPAEGASDRGNVLHIVNNQNDDAAVYRSITVEPNSTYKLSCYIKTKGVTGSPDGAGANIALRNIIARSPGVYGDSDWQLVELTGNTQAGQTSIVVSCRVGGYSSDAMGEAWFDGFKVEKLPDNVAGSINFYDNSAAQHAADTSDKSGSSSPVWIILLVLAVLAAVAFFIIRAIRRENGESAKAPKKASAQPAANRTLLDKIRGRSVRDVDCRELPAPTDNKLHLTKLDRIFMLVLTVVYGVIALLRLGSFKFPDSSFTANSGDSVRIEFEGGEKTVSRVLQNCGVSYSDYRLTADHGEVVSMPEKELTNYWNMFKWKSLSVPGSVTTSGFTLTVNSGDVGRPREPDLVLNELVFFDSDGNKIPCRVAGQENSPLFDEQDTVPEHINYMYGMYFDEVYHARTAFEHLHNLTVYEWTHPPLGKLIISIGILIFGMKPFGWRIMGTLFGIIMVPIMYCISKRILKRPQLCLLSTLLFAFDFMHFAQTRIATVDVYALFFTMLMTYYMYQFLTCDIGDGYKRMLKPLALSGLFFGLGCASKWTCIYTGAALAVMFFAKLVWLGARSAKLAKSDPAYADMNKKFRRRALVLCGWCVVFFIIVPAMIYCAAYCRYYTAQWKPAAQARILAIDSTRGAEAQDVKLTFSESVTTYVKGVLKNQTDMYNYHSGLKSDHSASSPWWMWLFNLRPTWFYISPALPNGNVGTISTFGNPAVWNICFFGTVGLIIMILLRKIRFTREAFFIFACLASSLLPWVFVERSTYAYHYFSSVPYIILASVYLLKYIEDMNDYKLTELGAQPTFMTKLIPRIKYIWMALALILFALFYPVISGLEVPREYIYLLQWVPFKKWTVNNPDGTVKRTLRMGWTFMGYGD